LTSICLVGGLGVENLQLPSCGLCEEWVFKMVQEL